MEWLNIFESFLETQSCRECGDLSSLIDKHVDRSAKNYERRCESVTAITLTSGPGGRWLTEAISARINDSGTVDVSDRKVLRRLYENLFGTRPDVIITDLLRDTPRPSPGSTRYCLVRFDATNSCVVIYVTRVGPSSSPDEKKTIADSVPDAIATERDDKKNDDYDDNINNDNVDGNDNVNIVSRGRRSALNKLATRFRETFLSSRRCFDTSYNCAVSEMDRWRGSRSRSRFSTLTSFRPPRHSVKVEKQRVDATAPVASASSSRKQTERRTTPLILHPVIFLTEMLVRGLTFRVLDAYANEYACGGGQLTEPLARAMLTEGRYVLIERFNGSRNIVEFRRQVNGDVSLSWRDSRKRTTDLCSSHNLRPNSHLSLDEIRCEGDSSTRDKHAPKLARLCDFSIFLDRCGSLYAFTEASMRRRNMATSDEIAILDGKLESVTRRYVNLS